MNTKSLVKLALSFLMVGIVLCSVNFASLYTTFLTMSPITVALVVIGYTLGQLLSSFKWWTIAYSGGIKTPYPKALKAYFIGMFLNCFSFGDEWRLVHGLKKFAFATASVSNGEASAIKRSSGKPLSVNA